MEPNLFKDLLDRIDPEDIISSIEQMRKVGEKFQEISQEKLNDPKVKEFLSEMKVNMEKNFGNLATGLEKIEDEEINPLLTSFQNLIPEIKISTNFTTTGYVNLEDLVDLVDLEDLLERYTKNQLEKVFLDTEIAKLDNQNKRTFWLKYHGIDIPKVQNNNLSEQLEEKIEDLLTEIQILRKELRNK